VNSSFFDRDISCFEADNPDSPVTHWYKFKNILNCYLKQSPGGGDRDAGHAIVKFTITFLMCVLVKPIKSDSSHHRCCNICDHHMLTCAEGHLTDLFDTSKEHGYIAIIYEYRDMLG